MTHPYHLAIDLGASGGRHILGRVREGRLELTEVHRFENAPLMRNGLLCWDREKLLDHILEGMEACAQKGKIPETLGIDSWGNDFVLLDSGDRVLGEMACYRDPRTQGMQQRVFERISREELYARTGIQMQPFNTLYQLMAVQTATGLLPQARRFLMAPDYFHFLLTGVKSGEYTNATTTQMYQRDGGDWDRELLAELGIPDRPFYTPARPGRTLGGLLPWVRRRVGYDCRVVLPATHDTASAVMAVPARGWGDAYLSSGTWSLLGVERRGPDCSQASLRGNFTNEGGYENRYRWLKNIMGLWLVQSVRRELPGRPGYGELTRMAARARGPVPALDVNDPAFLSPPSMTAAIGEYCRRTGQPAPEGTEELLSAIFHSLAACCGDTLREVEAVTGTKPGVLHVVGGGSKNHCLNQLVADAAGVAVEAGPAEATAVGNLMAQMIAAGELGGLEEGRELVRRSFEPKRFEPTA